MLGERHFERGRLGVGSRSRKNPGTGGSSIAGGAGSLGQLASARRVTYRTSGSGFSHAHPLAQLSHTTSDISLVGLRLALHLPHCCIDVLLTLARRPLELGQPLRRDLAGGGHRLRALRARE